MLRDNALFSGADATTLLRVLPEFRLAAFPSGAALYVRGRSARDVFLIVSGSVEIVQHTGPRRTTVAMLGPGEFTGEGALLQPAPAHLWTAVCREETHVAVADGEALQAAFAAVPGLGMNVARGLHRRVTDVSFAIDALVASR